MPRPSRIGGMNYGGRRVAKQPRKRIRPSFEELVLARIDRDRRDVVKSLFSGTWTFKDLVKASRLPAREVRWLIRRHQDAERATALEGAAKQVEE